VYTPEIQQRIIELLRDEATAGAFRIQKTLEMRPAYERVVDKLKVEFPDQPWLVEKIRDKYHNEKKRYQQFLTFLAISRTAYSEETGLVEGSEDN
jgi:hypothetical protein